jgi:hypothetical protein
VVVTGDVTFETEESATTFAIVNLTSQQMTVSVSAKSTSGFGVIVSLVGDPIDSVRAVLSYYAGALLNDNSNLQQIGFRAAVVSLEGTEILEGLYYRSCGTATSLETQSLEILITPVPTSSWLEPFTMETQPRIPVLDTANILQTSSDDGQYGCTQLHEDVITLIHCSADSQLDGSLDGTYQVPANTSISQFSAQMTFRDVNANVVTQPFVEGVPDMTVIINGDDQPLVLNGDSIGVGYITTATTVRGFWSPELAESYVGFELWDNLNSVGVYWDDQIEDFGVPVSTRVAPCNNPTGGCPALSVHVLFWTGEGWIQLAHGTVNDRGVFTPVP